jgi:hypothetical protein
MTDSQTPDLRANYSYIYDRLPLAERYYTGEGEEELQHAFMVGASLALAEVEKAESRGEARGRVQGLREALAHVQFEICGPTCGHGSCLVARSIYREITRAADAIEQEQPK